MRFTAVSSAFLGLAACVSAASITVKVGENGALTFTPSSVNATKGDVIAFQFLAGNHSVTQSTFDNPCTKSATGVDSGFQPVAAGSSQVPQYSFTVDNDTAPLWFYCHQGQHCKAGMVFAVNPTADKSFDAFKAKATGSDTGSSTSPGSSSTGSSGPSSSTKTSPSPSASGNPSSGGALGFDSPKVAGIITLVAILAGSVL